MIIIWLTDDFRLDIYNKHIKGDTNQMEAVQHIVAGSSYPLPYILIGFPGKIAVTDITMNVSHYIQTGISKIAWHSKRLKILFVSISIEPACNVANKIVVS